MTNLRADSLFILPSVGQPGLTMTVRELLASGFAVARPAASCVATKLTATEDASGCVPSEAAPVLDLLSAGVSMRSTTASTMACGLSVHVDHRGHHWQA